MGFLGKRIDFNFFSPESSVLQAWLRKWARVSWLGLEQLCHQVQT
jgi:hypothetical protein